MKVTITKKFQRVIDVIADDMNEALAHVRKQYQSGDFFLMKRIVLTLTLFHVFKLDIVRVTMTFIC